MLRDLVVGIDFDDINIATLLRVDSAMDAIEDQFRAMGGNISDAAGEFSQMSAQSTNAINAISSEANQAGNAMAALGHDAMDAGSDASHAIDNASQAVEAFGNEADASANEATNAIEAASDAINQLGHEANQTGSQATNAINDAADAVDLLGNEATQAGNQATNALNDAANSAENTGEAAEKAGGGFGLFGRAAGAAVAAVTAGLAAAKVAIIAFVTETDTAFDRFEAKTGTTGHELVELGEVAKNVYKGAFGESITQVTDDVAKLNSMFSNLDYGELQTLAEGAYTIADLWDQEVGQVGKTVKTMTATFKDLSESDAMDLMTTAFQKTGDYSDDLLDTFNEYSVYFQKLGFDAKGFTNILIKGASAGAFTMDKAADAIKEFGIRSIDASEATADGFKLVGLDADKMTKNFAAGGDTAQKAFAATMAGLAAMKDPVKQGIAGTALFGTQWEDLRETVILAMTDGKDAVGDFKGATKEAADTAYDNFGSRMTGVFRDLKLKIVDAFKDNGGEELLDTLANKAEELVPKIESMVGKAVEFAGAVRDNWPAIRETTIGITTAVGSFVAIMGALKIIGIINTLMVAYKAGTMAATLAQYGLNTAMLLNPVTWLVAGIAALIAVGVLLYRNWDIVKAKTIELWNKLGDFKGVATLVLGPLGFIIRAAVTMADQWDSTKGVWENVWNGIKIAASNAVNDVLGSINALIKMINKIPGVNIPIIPKVDWGAAKKAVSQAPSTSSGARVASHATGLERVPYDGYMAELHKDEAVLTAKQSDALRNTGMLESSSQGRPKLSFGQAEQQDNKFAPLGNVGEIAKGSTNNNNVTNNQTFAPSITIQVEGGNDNAETIAEKAAAAAKREIEKFWIAMNLKEA